MKKQFVTYEIALKLKELGFDEPCLAFYDEQFDVFLTELSIIGGNKGLKNSDVALTKYSNFTAPLWQQCLDWFREAHNLQVEILWRGDMSMFCYKIGRFRYASHEFSEVDYRQFEEAREQAILKALILIK